jgi:hypothetical protein
MNLLQGPVFERLESSERVNKHELRVVVRHFASGKFSRVVSSSSPSEHACLVDTTARQPKHTQNALHITKSPFEGQGDANTHAVGA